MRQLIKWLLIDKGSPALAFMDFSSRLLAWYDQNRRHLPWRHSNDPYLVWVSEVILQQTRMDKGIEYFRRFSAAFPDVYSLASASEEEVLRMWQGLGYYTRARNLHHSARELVQKNGGVLPETYQEWLQLKGVGPYTAAAIASMAFGEAVAALDGNGYRILARVFALEVPMESAAGEKAFMALAQDLLDPRRPGDFNQALMDFGSLVCTPAKPACQSCLFHRECLAFSQNAVARFPVRGARKPLRDRFFHYFDFQPTPGQGFFIAQRRMKDIWKGLYELPLLEAGRPLDVEDVLHHPWWESLFPGGKGAVLIAPHAEMTHKLTHQIIHARFFRVSVSPLAALGLQKYFMLSDGPGFEALGKHRLMERWLEGREGPDGQTRKSVEP